MDQNVGFRDQGAEGRHRLIELSEQRELLPADKTALSAKSPPARASPLTRSPYPAPLGAKSLAQATHDYIVAHHRALTTLLIAAARVMERVDESLLPAVYLYVACSFGATPVQLGSITFVRALVQALTSPIGGILGHYFNRAKLIAVAAATWSLFTALFARTTTVQQGMAVWAFNGVGLAVMIPNSQSLVADYYPAHQRGRAFGMLLAVGNLGSMLSVVFATNMGGHHFFGVEGWRAAFYGVSAFSLIMAVAIWWLAADPRCAHGSWKPTPSHPQGRLGPLAGAVSLETMEEEDPLQPCLGEGAASSAPVREHSSSGSSGSSSPSWKELLREIWTVISTPSFIVIILQGILGSSPWSAMAFNALFFQLQGWTDAAASAVLAVFNAFDALGAFLGGWVGDWAAQRAPDHGRILACQFSVGIGVPLALLVFKGLPMGYNAAIVVAYAACFAVMGTLISWAATACNNPVFAEVVPPHLRTLVYAFDRSFEGALSALGAPLVGLAAQRLFHFEGVAATADCSSDGTTRPTQRVADLSKATSLGSSLAIFTAVPWLLCAGVYCLLHVTYPRDKRRSGCTGEALEDVAFSPLAVEEALEGPLGEDPQLRVRRFGSL